MQEFALFSGKNYTVGTHFTRPPVVIDATNLNSAKPNKQIMPNQTEPSQQNLPSQIYKMTNQHGFLSTYFEYLWPLDLYFEVKEVTCPKERFRDF